MYLNVDFNNIHNFIFQHWLASLSHLQFSFETFFNELCISNYMASLKPQSPLSKWKHTHWKEGDAE